MCFLKELEETEKYYESARERTETFMKENGKIQLINDLIVQKNAKIINDNNNLKIKVEAVSEEREKFKVLSKKLKKKTNYVRRQKKEQGFNQQLKELK